ncbi:alkene reductase [Nonlabens sp. Ci31]|jgi:N-ethylmaleimide reductase|uniref:alkene reductase n=1 Tax=Nonlabens sp. Ci31 TaxID=2608253 RepID=UPI001463ABCD|nr:alkene reductase [Nonlabens sp. Ci31]QJP35521.1 alkene reductase [Nonlabens sp. Ci31]
MAVLEHLLSPLQGKLNLKNRVVMAPLTRSRSTSSHIPTPIMAAYYGERANAGLIITEGTSPSINGVGYPRIPGIYNKEQITAWKTVTDAVHANDGKIFLQMMHTGRVSHPGNMSEDAVILAPSAIAPANTKMYVDGQGELAIPQPKEMTFEEIEATVQEYVHAAKNAIEAGFDGVEIHGANGYLLEQFINPSSNRREDLYGGTAENRCRFILEVARRVVDAIGSDKTGMRWSPNGQMNDVQPFEGQYETYDYLSKEVNKLNILYVHLVNHASMGAPELPEAIHKMIQSNFDGLIILSGGYNKELAEEDLIAGKGDLVAFGRPFIANPDLVERFSQDAILNEPNAALFYTPGKEGYLDYPRLEKAQK